MSCTSPGSSTPCGKNAMRGSLQVVAAGHLAEVAGRDGSRIVGNPKVIYATFLTAYSYREDYQAAANRR
jgi:hypothetical protein